MQGYAKTNTDYLKTVLFFAVVLFLAYLPVSSFLFFIKNDAFNGYFPPKFFMSESLHAGQLPLWNPYINYGFPQYGDMSSGFWSPVTWLIASTVGYNAYSFTLEIMFYILAGGIGMYRLSAYWKLSTPVRIIAGLAFMCCGYNTGQLQHFNWLSGAALLPWCFYFYLLLFKNPSLKLVLQNIFCFYLLVASAHPGLSIGALYFFSAIFFFILWQRNKHENPVSLKTITWLHLALVAGFLMVAAAMLVSYADMLPHFVRGEKPLLATAQPADELRIQSWMSLLLPFSTVKNTDFFITDIAMRNCYIGLTGLVFLLLAITGKKSSWEKFLLFTGVVFALLSTAFLRSFTYNWLPLTGFVRLTGEFRIFSLLCFIVVAAIQLDNYTKNSTARQKWLKSIFILLTTLLSITVVYALVRAVEMKTGVFYSLGNIRSGNGITGKLKLLLESISFYDTLWIQGCLQLILLVLLRSILLKRNLRRLVIIVAADLIMATLLNVPYTGAGQASVAQLQQVLDRSPKGIPIPPLIPIASNDSLPENEKYLLGSWTMYNKQIGTVKEVSYPIVLLNMRTYLDKLENNTDSTFIRRPFIFSTNSNADDSIAITSFTGKGMTLMIQHSDTGTLVIQQNFYPHWYYDNGNGRQVLAADRAGFMHIPLDKGKYAISVYFLPATVKAAMLFSFISLLVLVAAIVFLSVKSLSLSSPKK